MSDSSGPAATSLTAASHRVIGIDIGGANLKYAATHHAALSRSFAMWRQPHQLAAALIDDLAAMVPATAIAVTMTGELADCFVDRRQGVRHIVDAACAAGAALGISSVWFYGVDGQFHDADRAKRDVDLVAAANWHALGQFVARYVARDATLVDIGSTTTDVIAIRDGVVATNARTDHQRLCEQSLVYIGCRRTPLCALASELVYQGRRVGVMNECFATIDDVRIVLGLQSEQADDTDTADGQARTMAMAANRIARMIGLDRRDVTVAAAAELAAQFLDRVQSRLTAAFDQIDDGGVVVLSGHGTDLLPLPADRPRVQLSELLGSQRSRCAPAWSVATLLAASLDQVQSTGEVGG